MLMAKYSQWLVGSLSVYMSWTRLPLAYLMVVAAAVAVGETGRNVRPGWATVVLTRYLYSPPGESHRLRKGDRRDPYDRAKEVGNLLLFVHAQCGEDRGD